METALNAFNSQVQNIPGYGVLSWLYQYEAGERIQPKDPFYECVPKNPQKQVKKGEKIEYKEVKRKAPPYITDKQRKLYKKIFRRAWYHDRNFCGCTPFSLGLGMIAIVSILPIIGAIITYKMHYKMIKMCNQAGCPAKLQAKMASNVGIDTAIALVPLLSVLFCWMNACSTRNFKLFDEWIRSEAAINAKRQMLKTNPLPDRIGVPPNAAGAGAGAARPAQPVAGQGSARIQQPPRAATRAPPVNPPRPARAQPQTRPQYVNQQSRASQPPQVPAKVPVPVGHAPRPPRPSQPASAPPVPAHVPYAAQAPPVPAHAAYSQNQHDAQYAAQRNQHGAQYAAQYAPQYAPQQAQYTGGAPYNQAAFSAPSMPPSYTQAVQPQYANSGPQFPRQPGRESPDVPAVIPAGTYPGRPVYRKPVQGQL